MCVPVPFPAMHPDTLRTLVVVGDDGEIAVAVREALPRTMVMVLDARPAEAEAAIGVCRPYPWAVAWASAAAFPGAFVRARPLSLFLVRSRAAEPPCRWRSWSTFGELVAQLRRMLGASAGGMRLAPGIGVQMPDGGVVRSAPLQALLSVHPSGLSAPHSRFRDVHEVLRAHSVGWTTARAGGQVRLVAAPAAS